MRSRRCRTSFASVRPAKPIWRWCKAAGRHRKRSIDTPLHKYLLPDGERRVRATTADDPDAMHALTLVKVRQSLPARNLQGLPPMSLLEVTIKTGRTHQIRVHLSSQGHGIVGDDKYGDFELNKRLPKARPQTHVLACMAPTVAAPGHGRSAHPAGTVAW